MTDMTLDTIHVGDALTVLRELPDGSVNCIVTSPPYFRKRDYGVDGQIGQEEKPSAFIAALVEIFDEVRRVLKTDGNCYVNLDDSYASAWPAPSNRRNVIGNGSIPNGKREARPPRMGDGMKEKDLMLIPHRFAIAMQDGGWFVREDVVWFKENPVPEGRGARDRCTRSHEYVFHFTKAYRYWYDKDAVAEAAIGTDGERRNRRSVWRIPASNGVACAHFATMPEELAEVCIKAGCPEGGVVLDPFSGAGTTALVAKRLHRRYIGIELNPEYVWLARCRIDGLMFAEPVEGVSK